MSVRSTILNIKTLYILHPVACVSCIDIRTNSDCVPKRYKLIGFCNPDGMYLVPGTNCALNKIKVNISL